MKYTVRLRVQKNLGWSKMLNYHRKLFIVRGFKAEREMNAKISRYRINRNSKQNFGLYLHHQWCKVKLSNNNTTKILWIPFVSVSRKLPDLWTNEPLPGQCLLDPQGSICQDVTGQKARIPHVRPSTLVTGISFLYILKWQVNFEREENLHHRNSKIATKILRLSEKDVQQSLSVESWIHWRLWKLQLCKELTNMTF